MSLIMTKDGWKQLQPLFHGHGCYNYPNAREAPVQEGLRYTGPLPTREAVLYGEAIQRYMLPWGDTHRITLENCMGMMSRKTVIE